MPSYVNYGGRSMADDGKELSRERFYQDLPNLTTHATTAAPPPALAEEVLIRHFEGADHLIAIVTPPKLAANYNSFRLGGASLLPTLYVMPAAASHVDGCKSCSARSRRANRHPRCTLDAILAST